MPPPPVIILSRTDGIGDVVLSFPTAGLLKQLLPGVRILFLGRSYTGPLITACEHVDDFVNWDEVSILDDRQQVACFREWQADAIVHLFPNREIARLASKSGIPARIGTSRRFHHWLTCNRLVNVGRKRSPLHEAQLNTLLLRSFGVTSPPPLAELGGLMGLCRTEPLEPRFATLLDPERINLILHPKSKGSAREWGVANFSRLIELLPTERYNIFISGSAEDGRQLAPQLAVWGERVTDITGLMPLEQFIAFISRADGLVACSTGPLHIAAALGRAAVGLYAPMRPIHPGRWAPLGPRAGFLVRESECHACRHEQRCGCIENIPPADVLAKLDQLTLR